MLTALALLPALAAEPTQSSLSEASASSEVSEHSVNETALVGGLGFASGEAVGGPAVSFSLLHRISFVELGGELYGSAGLGGMVGSAGGLLGAHVGSALSVRALAAVGIHGYDAVGMGLLNEDPGVGGSSPYVGGRVLLGYSFAHKRRLFLGIAGFIDEDLERQTKSSTYMSEPWLSGGEPTLATSAHSIGQTTWGALFVVGREFDLTGYLDEAAAAWLLAFR